MHISSMKQKKNVNKYVLSRLKNIITKKTQSKVIGTTLFKTNIPAKKEQK